MNWTALIPLAIKYGPILLDFIQREGPALQQFVKDVEAVLNQTQPAATKLPSTSKPGSFTS